MRKRPAHRGRDHERQEASAQTPTGSSDSSFMGLVVTRYGHSIDVEDEQGRVFRCAVRRKLGDVICGDRVVWQPTTNEDGVIIERLPRTTLLSRPDDRGMEKLIAANIDQVIVVCAVRGARDDRFEFNTDLVDRYIVAAETLSIEPLLIINKIDLLTDNDRRQLETDIAPYLAIGYRVLFTSTKQNGGMDALISVLQNRTSIFVGESGVGKSSLIRWLLPDQEIRVGELSASTYKGRHTTTSTNLYHLLHGGDLIDSPGVREFGLFITEKETIAYGFREFRPLIGHCKFNNCIHQSEPGCAIKTGVAQGAIDTRRYESYLKIIESLPKPGYD
ncbi:MAG: small ribosomal subunit biogenesis GTPase RsgA [Gammaproteobacteria bacterium]|nr:small ribosomal subunit biogenesis GTPase RsgA [Gammaproteobacteria bacterium]